MMMIIMMSAGDRSGLLNIETGTAEVTPSRAKYAQKEENPDDTKKRVTTRSPDVVADADAPLWCRALLRSVLYCP